MSKNMCLQPDRMSSEYQPKHQFANKYGKTRTYLSKPQKGKDERQFERKQWKIFKMQ